MREAPSLSETGWQPFLILVGPGLLILVFHFSNTSKNLFISSSFGGNPGSGSGRPALGLIVMSLACSDRERPAADYARLRERLHTGGRANVSHVGLAFLAVGISPKPPCAVSGRRG